MGGAIARGLARRYPDGGVQLSVANPTEGKLHSLKTEFPNIHTTTDNVEACTGADIIMLAVKPWIVGEVMHELRPLFLDGTVTLVSVAAGVGFDAFEQMLDGVSEMPPMMQVIPDTGALVGKSMTFVTSRHATEALVEIVRDIFLSLGEVAVIEEKLLPAATALSSCGIAYVYKFVQAYVQAGVELGFRPADALRYTLATVDGAVAMLQNNGTLPQTEIDRVTTPGGMTIKGINELEHAGFTSAVINAILKPLKK